MPTGPAAPAAVPPPGPDLRDLAGENRLPPLDRRRLLAAAWAGCWPAAFLSAKPLTRRERARLAGPVPVADTPAAAPAAEAPAASPEPVAPPPAAPALAGFGVSLAGAEFGVEDPAFSNANPGGPGGAYLYPTPGSIGDLAAAGVRLVRLPVRWERLQPAPGGELNADELARLRGTLDRLAAAGCAVIVDLHNYARLALAGAHFDGGVRHVLIDEVVAAGNGRRDVPVSRGHFAEFWAKLAAALAGHPAVAGWGLMNEPHDLSPAGAEFAAGGGCDWKAVSRLAAAAVRGVDPVTPIVVAGADWSAADRWPAANGPDPWVDDANVFYEAHCYFDADGSGKYTTAHAAERRRDPGLRDRGVRRAAPFLEWCARAGSRGFLGEFGVPAGPDPAEDGWRGVLRPFLRELAGAGVPGCLWAAGEWWGEYPLNAHPAGGVAGPVLGDVLAAGAT